MKHSEQPGSMKFLNNAKTIANSEQPGAGRHIDEQPGMSEQPGAA